MKLLLQLHQPSWGQVDVLQHHPPATPDDFCISVHQLVVQIAFITKDLTHLPDLTAVLMSLSALLKPSAEPVDDEETTVQRRRPALAARRRLLVAHQ